MTMRYTNRRILYTEKTFWYAFRSRDVFCFWKITHNISEMVQDGDTVAMKD